MSVRKNNKQASVKDVRGNDLPNIHGLNNMRPSFMNSQEDETWKRMHIMEIRRIGMEFRPVGFAMLLARFSVTLK